MVSLTFIEKDGFHEPSYVHVSGGCCIHYSNFNYDREEDEVGLELHLLQMIKYLIVTSTLY